MKGRRRDWVGIVGVALLLTACGGAIGGGQLGEEQTAEDGTFSQAVLGGEVRYRVSNDWYYVARSPSLITNHRADPASRSSSASEALNAEIPDLADRLLDQVSCTPTTGGIEIRNQTDQSLALGVMVGRLDGTLITATDFDSISAVAPDSTAVNTLAIDDLADAEGEVVCAVGVWIGK